MRGEYVTGNGRCCECAPQGGRPAPFSCPKEATPTLGASRWVSSAAAAADGGGGGRPRGLMAAAGGRP
eukprot:6803917-Prymnesium_polylepis.1